MKSTTDWKDRPWPASIYLCIVGALALYAAVVLYQHFPNMYTWEELFINYAGGFIRRGLIGEVLLQADRVVPMPMCYLILYTAVFFAFLHIAYKKLASVFDPLLVTFAFISPAVFLLPVTDRYVFGRKDVFIEILLLCITLACVRCLTREKPALCKDTACISLLFLLGAFIHEMMIFYFPVFAVLLGVAYAREKRIAQWACITGFLLAVSLFLAVMFSGDADMREAICASWRQSYPELKCERALRFIGASLHYGMTLASQSYTNWITLGTFSLGAVLSALPLFLVWKAYRPSVAIRDVFATSRILRIAFWPAVLAPWILPVIAVDYGRFLSITLISYLFFLYALCAVRPCAAAPWLETLKGALAASWRLRCALYVFAVAYGLFWRMSHSEPGGASYIMPGVLFHLQ